MARGLRQFHRQLSGEKSRDIISPFGVRSDVGSPFDEFPSFVHPLFILGVNGDEAARAVENSFKCIAFVDQQRTGGRAHEDLDTANARNGNRGLGRPHGVLEVAHVVGRCPDEKSVIVDALF